MRVQVVALVISVCLICTAACLYQAVPEKDGNRVVIVNTLTGSAAVVEGTQRFVPEDAPVEVDSKSALDYPQQLIPKTPVRANLRLMWQAHRALLSVRLRDAKSQADKFASYIEQAKLAGWVSSVCWNAQGFEVVRSPNLRLSSFQETVDSQGQTTSFDLQMELSASYPVFRAIANCALSWNLPAAN